LQGALVMADEHEQTGIDLDQTLSDAEQTGADVDQILSDVDQTSSEHDQISSDRDQAAADIDQATSEAEYVQRGDAAATYEWTRQMRADSTLERHSARHARGISSAARDQAATQRDGLAAARDLASVARDRLAAVLDAEIERLEREGSGEGDGRLGAHGTGSMGIGERGPAGQSRARAALQRRAAAEDRAHAARDRQFAALDRKAYAQELATAATDEVTGALRRGVGLAALQREMDRTARTGERLIVAFVDVDGLKAVNDHRGHSAGDALLRTVACSVSKEFRSYDLILRFGGDEFVCSFSGDGLDGIGKRFERVGAHLDEAIPGASISVGVSQRRHEDTIQTLLDRADTTMIAARRECCRRASGMARIDSAGIVQAPGDPKQLNQLAE
jgi:diguanylate cyclase (GGDEF)-like protein